MSKISAFLVVLFAMPYAVAQQKHAMFFEPEINLEYNVSDNYAHSFGIENRNFIYKNSGFHYHIKHLEFAHTSTFLLNKNQDIGLGIQYRFEENFIDNEENEFRILQEYNWSNLDPTTTLNHRFRNEQRFFSSTTKYRFRYQIGLSIPLGNGDKSTSFKTEAETLFEVAKTQKPEYEQRFSTLLEWQFQPKTNLEFGLQYRLANYTQNLGHELFLVTSFNVSL